MPAPWRSVRWSDFGMYEADRTALLVNHMLPPEIAVSFIASAVRVFSCRVRGA
jgi:hypothetical protein